jgi:hypothetical protein
MVRLMIHFPEVIPAIDILWNTDSVGRMLRLASKGFIASHRLGELDMALGILKKEETFWKDRDDPDAKDALRRICGNQALILQDFGVRGPGDAASGAEDSVAAPLAPYDPSWMHGLSKKELLDELNNFLLKRAQEDVFCVLILDEATSSLDSESEAMIHYRMAQSVLGAGRIQEAIAEAMKAVDPTIKLMGPELHQWGASLNTTLKDSSGRDWMVEFLKLVVIANDATMPE